MKLTSLLHCLGEFTLCPYFSGSKPVATLDACIPQDGTRQARGYHTYAPSRYDPGKAWACLIVLVFLATTQYAHAQRQTVPVVDVNGSPIQKHLPVSRTGSRIHPFDASDGGANNEPPPAGAILDLNGTPIPGGGDVTYQMYTATFTATLPSTAITFGFREDPAFLYFSNPSVQDTTTGSGNLLTNGNFAGPVYSSNGNDATPVGWTYANVYGATYGGVIVPDCGAGPDGSYGVGNCWYDGAVQAYDALTQTIATNVGDQYQISFWLADNSRCSIDGGAPCNFSDLSTNGDTTDTGGNGIDLTVYAAAALPAPDAIHFEVGVAPSGGPTSQQPNQAMLAIASAQTTAGAPATMADAAQKVGFEHFNWLQIITSNPFVTACASNMTLPGCANDATSSGTVPSLPSPDPALGGYAYQSSACAGTSYPLTAACLSSFPVEDYWSTYWDEYFWHPLNSDYYISRPSSPQYATQYRTASDLLHMTDSRGIDPSVAYGFTFSDVPDSNFIVPGTGQSESINFVTALVGVTGSCNVLVSSDCGFQIFPGSTFKWTSTNGAVNFTPVPGTTPDVAQLGHAATTGRQHRVGVEADTVVNPRDLTGTELKNSIISVDQFLAQAGLTPESLAAMGGGVSIFSASLIPSEAAALASALDALPTTTSVSLSPATNLIAGQHATATAVVVPASGTGIPTGTVTFSSPQFGMTVVVALNPSGMAKVSFTVPRAGTYTLTATYNGSSVYAGSASAPETQTVAAH